MAKPPQNIQICSIQLSQRDRVRLNGLPFPESLLDPLRSAISSGWAKGIQEERDFHGSYEFKLKGYPWVGVGEDRVDSCKLLASILKCLGKLGWVHLQSFDATRKPNDKDVLFFELSEPDPGIEVFAISFNRTDRIRIIGPSETWLIDNFKQIVQTGWTPGIQKIQNYCCSTEVKVSGNPWRTSDGRDSVAAKQFLCYLIASFRGLGYKLYASVDTSGRDSVDTNIGDLDVWIFRKVTSQWK